MILAAIGSKYNSTLNLEIAGIDIRRAHIPGFGGSDATRLGRKIPHGG